MNEKPLFGKFEIIKCFKKDDSLAVYLADHVYLNKKIILKTLNTRTIADQVVLERFKREAQLLAKINHPNIISVYDFGTFEEFFYISFEYFESQNLRQAFMKNSWSIDDKINILNQIASGLSETHHKKIIHRDLKPENILINENKEVKIADFGLAQLSGAEKLTAAEAIVGTPAYMTPEQIQGLNTNERSDLFSLGILTYEMFFGVNPFLGKDAGQTLNNIQTCRINTPPPHHGMPEYIPIIIDSLLKKDPSDRPKSIDFIFDFSGAKAQEDFPQEKSSKKYIYPAFIILGVIITVFVLLYVFDNQTPQALENKEVQDSLIADKSGPDSTEIITIEADTIKNEPIVIARSKSPVEKTQINDPPVESITKATVYGYLDIKCKPWANVLLDSITIDTTPFKEPYKIIAGEYTLQLQHPEYPQYKSTITISENDTLSININLDSFVGYFICNVFPWGDIYINNDYKGQTPLNRPIILNPGLHVLEVKNPGYESHKNEIEIVKSDTLKITVKLKSLINSN